MRAVVFAFSRVGAGGVARIAEAGFELALVITPDEPGDREDILPVKEACARFGIPCAMTSQPGQFGWIERIRKAGADMIFSLGYPGVLKGQILSAASAGAYGLHYSLLPRHRGEDPVRHAILAGEETTGVTLYVLETLPYSGGVVASREVGISMDDTAATLEAKLDDAADVLLVETLPKMARLEFSPVPQNIQAGPLNPRLTPEDGRIDWSWPAVRIHNLVRAFTRPFSGAYCLLTEELVFVWAARLADAPGPPPGSCMIMGENVLAGTGRGCLELVEIELSGRILHGHDLVRFFRDRPNAAFT